MSVAQRTRRSSSPTDRGELLGTIAGLVVVVPILGAMAYGAWMLIHVII